MKYTQDFGGGPRLEARTVSGRGKTSALYKQIVLRIACHVSVHERTNDLIESSGIRFIVHQHNVQYVRQVVELG